MREAEGRPFTRDDLYAAIMAGAVERVRPKMMTVVAIMAGLLPIMWSNGTGSEVMQRIAVPMIGGMISSTLLTLVVIPAIYGLIKGWGLKHGHCALPADTGIGGTQEAPPEREGRETGRGGGRGGGPPFPPLLLFGRAGPAPKHVLL